MWSSSIHLLYLQILFKYILNSLFSFKIWKWNNSLKYIKSEVSDKHKQCVEE